LGICTIFFLSSCEKTPKLVEISGRTMGTSYTIKYLRVESSKSSKILASSIQNILIKFNKIASTYISDSEISKINQTNANEEIILSIEFKKLLLSGIEISRKSKGYFDPSLGPLVNLWGFGPKGKRDEVPSEEKIREAKKNIGMHKFDLIKNRNVLIKKNKSQYLDFSAFAKGRGVDLISNFFKKENIEDFMIEIGGEVHTGSKIKTWHIGIETPLATKNAFQVVMLRNGALATSGDYRNVREFSKKKFSHGINFKSGRPKENLVASVSVYDPVSCMRADAWATALMVAGEFEGVKLAESNGLAAYFIYKESNNSTKYLVHRTKKWIDFVKEK